MSITVSALTAVDEPLWQDYVNSHSDATIYHTLEWREILYNEYRYEPAYFIAKEGLGEAEKIIGVLPMFLVKNLRGKRLVSLPFSIYAGPLCDSRDALYELIRYAIDRAENKGLKSLCVRGGDAPEELYRSKKYLSSVLKLDTGLDSIWDGLKYNTRTAVRRSQKYKLTFGFDRDDSAIEDFYSLQLMSRRRQGLPAPSIGYYKSIIDILKEKAKLALLRKDGKPLAGGLFFIYRDTILFAQGASDYRYQTCRPNDLLVWEVIKFAKRAGLKSFDFGLTPDGDNELLRFKRKWGAVSTPWYDYICPEGKKAGKTGIPYSAGSAIFKRLPLVISARVGRHVIRYLA